MNPIGSSGSVSRTRSARPATSAFRPAGSLYADPIPKPHLHVGYHEAVAAARQCVELKRTGKRAGEPRYNGPCPICGGTDRFWIAQGDTTVLIQCSHECKYHELLAALGLSEQGAHDPSSTPARASVPRRNPWLHEVWTATRPPEDTPGASYLVERRAVWLPNCRLPPPVRWLPASVAEDLRVRRNDWPPAAAGCLVYLLAAPGEAEPWALKAEAVTPDGCALEFAEGGKRPSLSGSLTDGGRRTFCAAGDRNRGIHLVEGPIDALALVTLEALGLVDLHGAAVLGADGIGGFTERACEGAGRVTLYPDGARWCPRTKRWVPEAECRAIRLAQDLERAGRGRVRIVRCAPDTDLADAVADEVRERRAIQQEEA